MDCFRWAFSQLKFEALSELLHVAVLSGETLILLGFSDFEVATLPPDVVSAIPKLELVILPVEKIPLAPNDGISLSTQSPPFQNATINRNELPTYGPVTKFRRPLYAL